MIIDKLKDLLQPANAAESEKANEAPRLDQKALCQLLETTLASIGCTPTWEDERDKAVWPAMSTKEAISLCASPRTIPFCAFATPSS